MLEMKHEDGEMKHECRRALGRQSGAQLGARLVERPLLALLVEGWGLRQGGGEG